MQSKLHLAHIACAEYLSGGIAEDVAIRIHKVDVVRGIVVLPLELKGLGFSELENFAQGQIDLIEARTTQRIMAYETLTSDSLRVNKSSRIEPVESVLIRHARISYLIGSHLIEVRVKQITVRGYREWQSSLEAADAAEIPTAENCIHGSADIGAPVPTATVR